MPTLSLVRLFIVTLIGLGLFGSFAAPAAAQPAGGGSYIVVLKAGANPYAAAAELGQAHGLGVSHVYDTVLGGFAATVPNDAALAALQRNPQVAFVEPDQVVYAFDTTLPGGAVLPTGIDRVGADGTTGPGAKVAVLDTGIASHPDLNLAGGYNCTTPNTQQYNDVHGHGTHVAGTIGAGGGVVGVAPGTPLYAMKVLDNSGSGTWSSVICGINETANLGIPYGNMSLGGASSENPIHCGSSSLHQAICDAQKLGTTFIVAAGNSSDDASGYVPAKYPEVVTVSALADSNGCVGVQGPDTSYGPDESRASFSNSGSIVDIAAPGVDIYSTAPGGGYARMSGTSMASPHVAGLMALVGYNYAEETSTFGEPIANFPNGIISCDGSGGTTELETTIDSGPEEGSATTSTSGEFAFSSNDPNATFECQLDIAGFSPCTSPHSYSVLDGLHTFEVRAKVGDTVDATPASRSWTVDTKAPTGMVTSPTGDVPVSGTVPVASDSADVGGSGVASAEFQSSPSPAADTSWTTVGIDSDGSNDYGVSWDTTFLNNGLYDLRVITTDWAGNSTTSVAVTVSVDNSAATPAAPSNVAARKTGPAIKVTWTDNATDELGYTLDREWTTDGVNWVLDASWTLGADTTQYRDTEITSSMTYRYCVAAFNNAGPSARACTNEPVTTSEGSAIRTDGAAETQTGEAGFVEGSTVVTTDGVNLRADASQRAAVITELAAGTVLTVTGATIQAQGISWVPVVTAEGLTGYVAAEFLATA